MKMNVMNEIKLVFRPEFLNRIDEILVFHPLGEPELKKDYGNDVPGGGQSVQKNSWIFI